MNEQFIPPICLPLTLKEDDGAVIDNVENLICQAIYISKQRKAQIRELKYIVKACNEYPALIERLSKFDKRIAKLESAVEINNYRYSYNLRLTTKKGELLKRCKNCWLWKATVNFAENFNNPDGLQVWCKSCQKEYRDKDKKANET